MMETMLATSGLVELIHFFKDPSGIWGGGYVQGISTLRLDTGNLHAICRVSISGPYIRHISQYPNMCSQYPNT